MYQTIQSKITNPNSINRLPLWRGLFLIPLLLVCFALSPSVRAVSPAPDGGYGGSNTAEGTSALFSLTTGVWNTALGFQALYHDTTGNQNTATGFRALFSNTTGAQNTATGIQAEYSNTDGFGNVAVGFQALYDNTTADYNTAVGYQAANNTTGFYNTAVGSIALLDNVGGFGNTAVGRRALENTSGSDNVGVGYYAGNSQTTGSGNVTIGYNVLGVAGESNVTRIRNVYSSVASARVVYVNSDNKIGTLSSSRRYKEDIKPMEKASETILALKPVTFRYKQEFDGSRAPMFGLIAEEVEKINPDLVSRNEKGEVDTVRYDAINAMLLNEFIKEHRKVQDLEATVAQQQKGMEVMAASLKEQATQIQKVSARLEASKPAPQVVANQ